MFIVLIEKIKIILIKEYKIYTYIKYYYKIHYSYNT
jgi:hypothetical protein